MVFALRCLDASKLHQRSEHHRVPTQNRIDLRDVDHNGRNDQRLGASTSAGRANTSKRLAGANSDGGTELLEWLGGLGVPVNPNTAVVASLDEVFGDLPPLSADERFDIPDLSDEEWDAFEQAIAE